MNTTFPLLALPTYLHTPSIRGFGCCFATFKFDPHFRATDCASPTSVTVCVYYALVVRHWRNRHNRGTAPSTKISGGCCFISEMIRPGRLLDVTIRERLRL